MKPLQQECPAQQIRDEYISLSLIHLTRDAGAPQSLLVKSGQQWVQDRLTAMSTDDAYQVVYSYLIDYKLYNYLEVIEFIITYFSKKLKLSNKLEFWVWDCKSSSLLSQEEIEYLLTIKNICEKSKPER